MSFIDTLKRRSAQHRGNSFIKSLKGKSELEVKQIYLDTKDVTNNEVVLSHLFFTYPSIISVLPTEYQTKMINSNFPMFKYGSDEARKALVSRWLKENKFIINSRSLRLDTEEYESYICMYFNQPEDVSKLYMEDLTNVLNILMKHNVKKTEEIVESMKDKLTDRQWDFILKVNKSFIKYANQNVQKKYSDDEEFIKYISGPARDNYVKLQIKKITEDISLLSTMPLDIQKEYIDAYPFMINYIDEETVSELLKYDEGLIKYLNVSLLKKHEALYSLLESAIIKGTDNIIDIFVNKSLLNAKNKLYRYDKNSSSFCYQYNKRIIKIIQSMNTDQILSLINVDSNYALPYIVPLYSDNSSLDEKKDATLEANSRCLNIFKLYYNDENLYKDYYKTINKIYSEYIENIYTYDYSDDYNCIFELFKLLFNKDIIKRNTSKDVNLYIGIMLLYKGKETEESKKSSNLLFKGIIKNAYNYEIEPNDTIYSIGSLELLSSRLSFIPKDLLNDFKKYNYVNISSLLNIVKNDKDREAFKYYFDITSNIFGNNKEMLFKSLENFSYYKDLINDVMNSELNDEQIDNLVDILSSFNNNLNIKTKKELIGYDLALLKKLIKDLSDVNDENIYRDLFCKYFFGKSYSVKGNTGWLDSDTLEQICSLYEPSALKLVKENGVNKYTDEEIKFYTMIKLLLDSRDIKLLISFIDNAVDKKINRNIIPIISFFSKLDKDKKELINLQAVSIDDIESLYQSNPDLVNKREEDGVIIYNFNGQDFKIINSYSDDGVHYEYKYLSQIDRNCFGYNSLSNDSRIRFTTSNGQTLIKVNKDSRYKKMEPNYMIVDMVTPDVLETAKNKNLRIIESSRGVGNSYE